MFIKECLLVSDSVTCPRFLGAGHKYVGRLQRACLLQCIILGDILDMLG